MTGPGSTPTGHPVLGSSPPGHCGHFILPNKFFYPSSAFHHGVKFSPELYQVPLIPTGQVPGTWVSILCSSKLQRAGKPGQMAIKAATAKRLHTDPTAESSCSVLQELCIQRPAQPGFLANNVRSFNSVGRPHYF